MALIRNADARNMARDAVVLDLGDLRRQGETMLERARAEATALLERARGERERIIAGADAVGYEKGLRRGHEEGLARGIAEGRAGAVAAAEPALRAIGEAWTSALRVFEAERERLVCEAMSDLVRLSVAIAERLTHRVIEADPTVVQDQLREVVSAVLRPTRLVVSICPADRELIEAAMPSLMATFTGVTQAEIVDDASLERGSVLAKAFESCDAGGRAGAIDASVRTGVRRMAELLLPGAGADGNPPGVHGGGA